MNGYEDPPSHDGWRTYAIWTVAIAAASTACSALASWAVDELKHRYGSKAVQVRIASDKDSAS